MKKIAILANIILIVTGLFLVMEIVTRKPIEPARFLFLIQYWLIPTINIFALLKK